MKNFTKRTSVAVASLTMAGGAPLGAGGTASAATPTSGQVKSVAVSTEAMDHGRAGIHNHNQDRDYRLDGKHGRRWSRDHDHRWDHSTSRTEDDRRHSTDRDRAFGHGAHPYSAVH